LRIYLPNSVLHASRAGFFERAFSRWGREIGIELGRDDPSFGWVMRIATIVEPSLYAVGVTFLAARWFCWRRRHSPVQVAA
jgi:hypothetical protein